MVREIGGELDEVLPLDEGGIDFSEHSKPSKAKKVIMGPVTVTADPADPKKTIAPIALPTATSTVLIKGKAYRLIGDGSFYFNQNNDSTITAGDVYVHEGAIILKTDIFERVAITFGTATFVQAVEVR